MGLFEACQGVGQSTAGSFQSAWQTQGLERRPRLTTAGEPPPQVLLREPHQHDSRTDGT